MDTDIYEAPDIDAGESRLAQIFIEAMSPSAPEKLRRLAAELAEEEGQDALNLLQQAAKMEKSRLQSIKAQGSRRRQIKRVSFRFDPVDVWILRFILQRQGLKFADNRGLVIRETLKLHLGKPQGRLAREQMRANEGAIRRAIDWGRMSKDRKAHAKAAAERINMLTPEELSNELRAVLERLDLPYAWE